MREPLIFGVRGSSEVLWWGRWRVVQPVVRKSVVVRDGAGPVEEDVTKVVDPKIV